MPPIPACSCHATDPSWPLLPLGLPCCSLWRIMRIMHGVAEAMELNHSQELQQLQLRSQQMEAVSAAGCLG